MYRKNVAGQFIAFQGVDATTGGIKSGVTWTIRRCIDGTFAAGGGTATEDGTAGWYKYAMSQADSNGNDIQFNFTGTGAVPQTINILTTAADPSDATNFGLSKLTSLTFTVAAKVDANTLAVGGTTQTAGDLAALINALNNLSSAQVKTQVVAALNTDTYAEPGQGAPPSTATIVQKLGYLFKAWRNRTTQTASQYSLMNDDAVTVDQKASFSDNGTTADRGEIASGP